MVRCLIISISSYHQPYHLTISHYFIIILIKYREERDEISNLQSISSTLSLSSETLKQNEKEILSAVDSIQVRWWWDGRLWDGWWWDGIKQQLLFLPTLTNLPSHISFSTIIIIIFRSWRMRLKNNHPPSQN